MEIIKIVWEREEELEDRSFPVYLNLERAIEKSKKILTNLGVKLVLEKRVVKSNNGLFPRIFIDGEPIEEILKRPKEKKYCFGICGKQSCDEICEVNLQNLGEDLIFFAIFFKFKEKFGIGGAL